MGSLFQFIASLISFRIAISSLRLEVAKGHVIERTIGSWTSFLNPINLVRNKDGALGIKAMGFSFRFGIQDWFDFGFRIGARKPSPKPTGKEVLVHPGGAYNIRYTGSVGRRVELKDEMVRRCSHLLSPSSLYNLNSTFQYCPIAPLSLLIFPCFQTLDQLGM